MSRLLAALALIASVALIPPAQGFHVNPLAELDTTTITWSTR